MTNPEARAADIIDHVGDEPSNVIAAALATEGLLAPSPQIIRTREELADLDRETLVAPAYPLGAGWHPLAQRPCYLAADAHRLDLTWSGPVVVIATGDQVRATRDAISAAKGENQ